MSFVASLLPICSRILIPNTPISYLYVEHAICPQPFPFTFSACFNLEQWNPTRESHDKNDEACEKITVVLWKDPVRLIFDLTQIDTIITSLTYLRTLLWRHLKNMKIYDLLFPFDGFLNRNTLLFLNNHSFLQMSFPHGVDLLLLFFGRFGIPLLLP